MAGVARPMRMFECFLCGSLVHAPDFDKHVAAHGSQREGKNVSYFERRGEEAMETTADKVQQVRDAKADKPRREVQARRFYLQRDTDVTGTSGTGKVAEGVQFSGGRVALTWHSHFGTVAVYDNMAVVEHLHGHDGATKVVWVDQP